MIRESFCFFEGCRASADEGSCVEEQGSDQKNKEYDCFYFQSGEKLRAVIHTEESRLNT